MNIMTSLLLLSNQVCAIYSRLFINFALIIIIKRILAHIQTMQGIMEGIQSSVACLDPSESL